MIRSPVKAPFQKYEYDPPNLSYALKLTGCPTCPRTPRMASPSPV
jgi:hypothetical protein